MNSILSPAAAIALARSSMICGALVLTPVADAQFSPGFESNTVSEIFAMEVFDDGGGDALYAGGNFGNIDSVPVNRVARWDGAGWSAVGDMPETPGLVAAVQVLEALDDGGATMLYAGGGFREIGGVAADRIARWDGVAWQALGEGLNSEVLAITTFDDGDGPRVYAGTRAGGVHAWDGASWSTIINPTSVDGAIHALADYDDGGGAKLYFGGDFSSVGPVDASFIASWDGNAVAALAGGLDATFSFRKGVHGLSVFEGRLFAGGNFDRIDGQFGRDVAAWDGASWDLSVDDPPGGPVRSMTLLDDGSGAKLIVTGDPIYPGMSARAAVAQWDGASWTPVHSADAPTLADLEGSLNGPVYTAVSYDDGTGPALHVGGSFSSDGIRAARNAARFRVGARAEGTAASLEGGAVWSGLSAGASRGLSLTVNALERLSFGGQTSLFAAGRFQLAGSVVADGVAALDAGSEGWRPLRERLESFGRFPTVRALTVFDDGGGERLIAGGNFEREAVPVLTDIAAWDGTSWSPLVDGQSFDNLSSGIYAFEAVDFGGGPKLIVAGDFERAGAQIVGNIAQWDGVEFTPLTDRAGTGTSRVVRALAFFDDGSGPALYVGGDFAEAGGSPIPFLARWDGVTWSSVGPDAPNRPVYALEVWDDGGGPALYVGGLFGKIGEQVVNFVAKWNGASFETLSGPSGVGLLGGVNDGITSMRVVDAGDGPKLYVGGPFDVAGGQPAKGMAAWDGSRWSAMLGANEDGFRRVGSETGPNAIVGYDDGDGPALWGGGDFTSIYGLASDYIGRYQATADIFADGFESADTSAWSSAALGDG